jgi:hypothetical protein
METKDFLEQLEAMTQRAFDKLKAERPDFNLYTVLIHINFADLAFPNVRSKKKRKKNKAVCQRSKAICSIGFDDQENALRCVEIRAESLHPKDEARYAMRTYNPEELLLKNVEEMVCEDVDVMDVTAALGMYEHYHALVIGATVRAQKFNICNEAEMSIHFKQQWLGYFSYSFASYKKEAKEEIRFDTWCRIAYILIALFAAYKILSK